MKILISACLMGEKVRYDGRASRIDTFLLNKMKKNHTLIALCPEVSGGLSTPRVPAEIQSGDGADVLLKKSSVMTSSSEDVTEAFLKGAHNALDLCQKEGIKVAILKSKSPSCGVSSLYDGSFKGVLKEGAGVTATLLKQNGIKVFNENELQDILSFLS